MAKRFFTREVQQPRPGSEAEVPGKRLPGQPAAAERVRRTLPREAPKDLAPADGLRMVHERAAA